MVMKRNTLGSSLGCSGGRRSAGREEGHEATSGGRMNGAVRSVRARVETNGQPRMFVINQFVEPDQKPRQRELGQQTGLGG